VFELSFNCLYNLKYSKYLVIFTDASDNDDDMNDDDDGGNSDEDMNYGDGDDEGSDHDTDVVSEEDEEENAGIQHLPFPRLTSKQASIRRQPTGAENKGTQLGMS